MKRISQEAGHRPAVAARRQNTKPPGGAKRSDTKTVRTQLHLGEQTAKRLAVHAALVGRNASRVADEILDSYLSRFGRGREIFDAPDGSIDNDPGDSDDRPSRRGEISPDAGDGAA
jgi:hypothetical protein